MQSKPHSWCNFEWIDKFPHGWVTPSVGGSSEGNPDGFLGERSQHDQRLEEVADASLQTALVFQGPAQQQTRAVKQTRTCVHAMTTKQGFPTGQVSCY